MAMGKERIIEMAKETFCKNREDFDLEKKKKEKGQNNKGKKNDKGKKSLSKSQIQTYMGTAKNADVFDEYLVFLEYQFERNLKGTEVAKSIITDVKKLYKEYKGEKWQDAIAYYFGTLKRLVVAQWNCEESDGK